MFNAFPGIVLVLSAVIIGVTMVQLLGPVTLENRMFEAAALIGGPLYADMPRPLGPLAPLVLHVFLHGGWLHLGMNMAFMAAFAAPVALALGPGLRGALLFLGFFFVCALGGGLAQMLVFQFGAGGIAIGASSALSGLLPAAGWARGGRAGAMRLAIPWLVINIVLALTDAAIALPIAWAAHLGGLAAGLVLFPLFLALRARPGPWSPPLR